MKNGINVLYSVSVVSALLYLGSIFGTSNMFIVIGCIITFYFINQGIMLINSSSLDNKKKVKSEHSTDLQCEKPIVSQNKNNIRHHMDCIDIK